MKYGNALDESDLAELLILDWSATGDSEMATVNQLDNSVRALRQNLTVVQRGTDELRAELTDIKSTVESLELRIQPTPAPIASADAITQPPIHAKPKWLKRNWIAVLTCVMAAAAWIQPQWSQHKREDLTQQIDRQIDAKLVEPSNKIGKQEQSLSRIEGKLDGVLAIQKGFAGAVSGVRQKLPTMLKNIAKGDLATLSVLPVYLVAAREQNISIPSEILTDSGKQILSETTSPKEHEDSLWQIALQLLNYRSYLNVVTPSEVRMLRLMIWPESPSQSSFDLSSGGAERMVFRNYTIYYDGRAPLHLKNVSFANCEFYMPRTSKSKRLAQAIFDSRIVSVDSQ